jgi:hypothetical protein
MFDMAGLDLAGLDLAGLFDRAGLAHMVGGLGTTVHGSRGCTAGERAIPQSGFRH